MKAEFFDEENEDVHYKIFLDKPLSKNENTTIFLKNSYKERLVPFPATVTLNV
jgi:hypothetical protein